MPVLVGNDGAADIPGHLYVGMRTTAWSLSFLGASLTGGGSVAGSWTWKSYVEDTASSKPAERRHISASETEVTRRYRENTAVLEPWWLSAHSYQYVYGME